MFDPTFDGIDHINIYSRARTQLGRLLTNFAHTPFEHPEHGHFESVEGFWYYVKTGHCHDELRDLWGFKAKQVGKVLPVVDNFDFDDEIRDAMTCKVAQNPFLTQQLIQSTLPFTHYYVMGDNVVEPVAHRWQPRWWGDYRTKRQQEM